MGASVSSDFDEGRNNSETLTTLLGLLVGKGVGDDVCSSTSGSITGDLVGGNSSLVLAQLVIVPKSMTGESVGPLEGASVVTGSERELVPPKANAESAIGLLRALEWDMAN